MIKNIIRIAAFGLIFGATLLFLMIFFIAYFTPEKRVIVDINSLGEANFELALAIFTVIILPWFFFDHVRVVKSLEKKVK